MEDSYEIINVDLPLDLFFYEWNKGNGCYHWTFQLFEVVSIVNSRLEELAKNKSYDINWDETKVHVTEGLAEILVPVKIYKGK